MTKKAKDFSAHVYKILSASPTKDFNYKQIAAIIEVNDTQSRNEIIKELGILKKAGKIEETERGKFKIISKAEYYEGTVDMTTRKSGYFICSELEDDVYIPFINLT